jgi:hypothetical protein
MLAGHNEDARAFVIAELERAASGQGSDWHVFYDEFARRVLSHTPD